MSIWLHIVRVGQSQVSRGRRPRLARTNYESCHSTRNDNSHKNKAHATMKPTTFKTVMTINSNNNINGYCSFWVLTVTVVIIMIGITVTMIMNQQQQQHTSSDLAAPSVQREHLGASDCQCLRTLAHILLARTHRNPHSLSLAHASSQPPARDRQRSQLATRARRS